MRLDLHKDFKIFKFPAGEVGVKLELNHETLLSSNVCCKTPCVELLARINTSDDIMALMLAKDALDELNCNTSLILPYVPYARQDRVCNSGESLSIRVFAKMINSCGFKQVLIYDPHSDVTPALINNCVVAKQVDVMDFKSIGLCFQNNSDIILCPDAGALKKTNMMAKKLGNGNVVLCEKERNLATGEITGTKIYTDSLEGKHCVIFDDICDGGRTFIEIAKKARELGAKQIMLIVTHGIFSKGLEPIFKYIDFVVTSDTFKSKKDYVKDLELTGLYAVRFHTVELFGGKND